MSSSIVDRSGAVTEADMSFSVSQSLGMTGTGSNQVSTKVLQPSKHSMISFKERFANRAFFKGNDDDEFNIRLNRMKKQHAAGPTIAQYLPAIAVLLICVIAGALAYWALLLYQLDLERSDWWSLASDHTDAVAWELLRVVGDLNRTSSFMMLQTNWRADGSRKAFHDFAQGILDSSPGTRGITWVPFIANETDRAILEKQAYDELKGTFGVTLSADGTEPYRRIWNNISGTPLAASQMGGGPWRVGNSVYDHAYYPVHYLTPIKGNERALDFDLSSNFARNYTISRAVSTGLPASTSRLTLVQTANAPTLYGMILFLPVYQQLTCPKPGEKGDMYLALRRYQSGDKTELCPTLVGLVNAVFTIQYLIENSRNVQVIQNLNKGTYGLAEGKYLWNSAMLDLGDQVQDSGWVGVEVFKKDDDCSRYGRYSQLGIDELYASLNMSTTSEPVQKFIAETLEQVCKSRTEDDLKMLEISKTGSFQITGQGDGGAFLVRSYFVGSRRWMYIVRQNYAGSSQQPAPIALITLFCFLGVILCAGILIMVRRRFQMQVLNDELLVSESKTNTLLLSIFPEEFIPRVLSGEKLIAERYNSATILFSDIVGFTSFAAKLDPQTVVEALNLMYVVFDDITELHGVFKVETIGDGYMISAGCPNRSADHCKRAVEAALDMIAAMPFLRSELVRRIDGIQSNPEARRWASNMNIRIGVHTGECFAGVAGKRNPRFHVFGDTVNTASRMESNGERGKIQVSEAVVQALMGTDGLSEFAFSRRGPIQIKGKGAMDLYFIDGKNRDEFGRTVSQKSGASVVRSSDGEQDDGVGGMYVANRSSSGEEVLSPGKQAEVEKLTNQNWKLKGLATLEPESGAGGDRAGPEDVNVDLDGGHGNGASGPKRVEPPGDTVAN